MNLEAKILELERRLTALERVENVAFIENIARRAGGSAKVQSGASSVGTGESVRNAADTGSESVAATYDGVLTITDAQGNSYRVGYYT